MTATVLVDDDEDTTRVLAKRMLERLGFDVILTCDGREGVERYREHADEIAVVLMDMEMPHMNGEEALREIRAIRDDAKVVLTSGSDADDTVEGFAGFLQKPYGFNDLAAILGRLA